MYMDKKKDTTKDNNVGAFFQTCKVKGSCVMRFGREILDLSLDIALERLHMGTLLFRQDVQTTLRQLSDSLSVTPVEKTPMASRSHNI